MKKIFTYSFLNSIILTLIFTQKSLTQELEKDPPNMNMDAVFNRPTITPDDSPISIGGYLEANTLHKTVDEGDSGGLSFQAGRLTLFLFSSFTIRINSLTEFDFKDVENEGEFEFEALD